MIAEFYIVNHSFRCPENIDIESLEEKIKLLSEDYLYIRKYKETDKILVHPSIYEECIYEDLTIEDFLYSRKWKKYFDRDTQEYLRIIIDHSDQTENTLEDIIDVLLPEQNEDLIHGLLCLHQIEGIDEQFLVYDRNNWLAFHRHFLGLYPKNENHFFNECIKYFPDLFFHERNEETITKIFPDFVQKIIFHLTALNDEFRNYQNEPYQRIETLKAFSIGCNLDQEASNEGDAKRKKRLNFDFINNEKIIENVCCEPHLKLCKNDNEDGKFYFHRIYFYEGKDNIADGKILIGHIGEHL
ncbi:MAG: hypothetical protein AB8G11_04755 [Saprospiraceae bacterium]